MTFRSAAKFFAMAAIAWSTSHAADGDLDTSFGVNGIARVGLSDVNGGEGTCKPVVQTDGKILICATRLMNGASGADMLVARFNADGTPDTSFSFDGVTTIDFAGDEDAAGAIALQADGRIVVVGTTDNGSNADFAAARLTADGTLDTTFGGGTGKTTIAFDLAAGGGADAAGAVALQSDGRIVIAGKAATLTGTNVAVTRLLPDGTRDSSFNLNGRVNFGFAIPNGSDENDSAAGVAIDDAGRIVLGAAVAYTDASMQGQNLFGAARLLSNGELDADFDADGRATAVFDPGSGVSGALCTALVLEQNGRIVITGYANSSTSSTLNYDIAVLRLLPDGSADSSFGFGGKVLVPFDLAANGTDAAFGGVEQRDGRLVIVGTSLGNANVQFATAVRLMPDGSLDESFGSFGKQTYDFALTTPDAQAFSGIAFQGTQLIVNGVAYVPPGGSSEYIDAFVARLLIDQIFLDGFD